MSLMHLRLLKLLLYIVRGLEVLVRLAQRALLALLVLPVQLALREQQEQVVRDLLAQRDQQAAQARAALQVRQAALARLVAQAQAARQGQQAL